MRRAKMGRMRISFTHTRVISVLRFLFRGIKNSIDKRGRIFFSRNNLYRLFLLFSMFISMYQQFYDRIFIKNSRKKWNVL